MEDIKVLMSEDGLKTITKIPYTSNFQGIYWTSEKNTELPVKMP
jgi:hypothetical protein